MRPDPLRKGISSVHSTNYSLLKVIVLITVCTDNVIFTAIITEYMCPTVSAGVDSANRDLHMQHRQEFSPLQPSAGQRRYCK